MYDTKTIDELEELATNLRLQIALYPDHELELGQLRECERWISVRRRELGLDFQRAS